jgi:hypothetical protein
MRLLHTARRRLELDDADYRTYLRNLGGCESSTQLDNRGFERIMAAWEDIPGFPSHPAGSDYWRSRVNRFNVSSRQLRMIFELAEQVDIDLGHFCSRMTAGTCDHPARLTPRDARNVIEALRKMIDRGYRPKAGRSAGVSECGRVGGTDIPVCAPSAGGTDISVCALSTLNSQPSTSDDDIPF